MGEGDLEKMDIDHLTKNCCCKGVNEMKHALMGNEWSRESSTF